MRFSISLIALRSFAKSLLKKGIITNILYERWKGRYHKEKIFGNSNEIIIGQHVQCYGTLFEIHGNNNRISIGYGCMIGPKCRFVILGDNVEIKVGKYCSFHDHCFISASENNCKLTIGDDAQFSSYIVVRTSDDHPIYDIRTGERINPAKSVTIEEHVWVAPNTKIMKGSNIHSGSVIGSDTTINGEVPANCLAVGRPFRIVKENINWERYGCSFKL